MPQVTAHVPTVEGGALEAVTWIEVTELPDLSVQDLHSRLIGSLQSLATLAVDADCPLLALEATTETSDGGWLTLTPPALGGDAPAERPADRMLLPLPLLGLEVVAAWLSLADRLHPLPGILAEAAVAAVAAPRLLDSQLLELCVVAESVHRGHLPQNPRMSVQEADRVRAAAREAAADLDKDVQQAFRGVLAHLEEPGYGGRLRELVAVVADSMPGLVGRPGRWREHVGDARNGFAHTYGSSTQTWQAHLCLLLSLRWLLPAAGGG